jgi:hypothetical protein
VPHKERNTCEAARRIVEHLVQAAAGPTPDCSDGWHRLAERMGIYAKPLYDVQCEFTARLIYDERLTCGWLIVYNGRAHPRQVCHYVCHELAEYLALCDCPDLFHDMPQQVYAYTGGKNPDDARHVIARRVEGLCFAREAAYT